jgi:hypothetical protein
VQHVYSKKGTSNTCFERVHGGFGYSTRNQKGEDALSFDLAYDMIVANTLFKNRESNLVTFSSDHHCSLIDFHALEKRRQRCMPRLQGDTWRECCPSA